MQNSKVKVKDLRIFGFIWSFIFLMIFLKSDNIIFVITSAIFMAISMFYPLLFVKSRFYGSWIKFGNFVGKINSFVIISILFYLIFIPFGLVIKIFKKDFLNLKIDKKRKSYFEDCSSEKSSMLNQY